MNAAESDLILQLDVIGGPDSLLHDSLELRMDSDGGLWLNDEPMTVMEARHFWSVITFAMNQDNALDALKKRVEIALHDAGTMQACARKWTVE
jgi:hypothetical protein